ncbi:MAG: DUF2330 domain-containing protein [Deltaproteobacteria bacterium]|nr:DUF2330 domain-containing protein [Deltaproteobacteria bacterium]
MRRWMTALAFAGAACLWAPAALPCGGGWGMGLTINTDQKIFVAHKNGVETYFFSPHFCGQSASFGMILPVPATLSSNPHLGEPTLVAELEDVTRPTIEKRTDCINKGSGGGSQSMDAGYNGADGGVEVIDKGKVGIFDWTLLQATETKAFTDWLDANKYPYDPAAVPQFQHYVDSGWYFVAFKITADTQDPPAGKRICGDLGPIMLSFASQKLVIPARIAAASDPTNYQSFAWRLFVIADAQQTVNTQDVYPTLRYSGAVSPADVANHAAIGKLTQGANPVVAEGDRLTELDVIFYPGQLTKDIELSVEPNPQDLRRVEYDVTYILCQDGGVGGTGASSGAGGTGASSGDAGQPQPPPEEAMGGGGCATGRSNARGGALALLLALGAFFSRKRKIR